MNGVLRMQPSRHLRTTLAMLDLMRLYWNRHESRAGPRKGTCPYRALGLGLPTFDFWEPLRTDPSRLAQRLSTVQNTEWNSPEDRTPNLDHPSVHRTNEFHHQQVIFLFIIECD